MNQTPLPGRAVSITGTGSYLPAKILTNADLEKIVETTDEWILTRTGIRERRIAAEGETASTMGAQAARAALEMAGVDASEVGMIVVGTVTPDMMFPNTACFVQDQIKAKKAFCMDIEAACSGFLYSLETARQYIASGFVDTALVIGSEKLSCVTDWTDRGTCILFGDGAGAVVLQAAKAGRGIMNTVMGSDGSLNALLNLPGGGSRYPASAQSLQDRMHFMKMSGNEVFKHAVRCMCDAAERVLKGCDLKADDVRWVIPHQANMRIIQAIANRFHGNMDRFIVNLDRVGNISGASIPVAMDEAVRAGKISRGDLVLLVAFGGGFTWSASVMEW
jgi:3-oxoacyl-[acyl-carrier-protein] synthase III